MEWATQQDKLNKATSSAIFFGHSKFAFNINIRPEPQAPDVVFLRLEGEIVTWGLRIWWGHRNGAFIGFNKSISVNPGLIPSPVHTKHPRTMVPMEYGGIPGPKNHGFVERGCLVFLRDGIETPQLIDKGVPRIVICSSTNGTPSISQPGDG